MWRKVREEIRERNAKEFIENLPDNTDPDKAKKQKETIERQKNQFRQIKQSLRKQNTGCIAHIIVPEPGREYPYDPEKVQNWKEIYEPKEVENELLKRNKAHFSQAARTPFATREMLERIPFTADSEMAEKVLEGEEIEMINEEAKQILRECRKKIEEE